ncbi:phage tail protein [Paenalcaligenes niemegkensis]|uniref:phage tail protein n=1 Tax=Paenalcaligenes niemegkensis TaxID=2895469 RepID=UPI001EE782E3|nr:phage tail protein [Paenalcaligenes niemegkensis]MCQ9618404.1 phage tail protein [Paenalcaligenes niemegkensis]
MATETFTWNVKVGSSGDIEQSALENTFGDGYTQSFGIGINNESQSWSVSKTGKFGGAADIDILPVEQFLKRHGGWKSFYWTPPGGDQGRYKATGRSRQTHGNGVYTLSWTMQEVFYP